MTLLLSIVIPTYNERENITCMLENLMRQLQPLAGRYEILVVDDQSPDGTADAVQAFAAPAVRVLRRSGRRDLAAALAEGFDHARGDYVLAMDADLQHDAAAVPAMLHCAQESRVSLVIATRYADGGSVKGWSWLRLQLSALATRLAQRHLAQAVSDPLSGFFLLQRSAWQRLRPSLQPAGFKLLLEILAKEPGLRCAEVGYGFVPRQRGSSKLDVRTGVVFVRTLWRMARAGR